jgi:hypothetical protein
MTNHKDYTYQLTWSAESKEYVGTCLEFPSLSWLDISAVQALIGIMQTIQDTLDKWDDKEPPPTPLPKKRPFSSPPTKL